MQRRQRLVPSDGPGVINVASPQETARVLIAIARTPWKWRLSNLVALALLVCSGITLFMWVLSGELRDPSNLFFGVLSALGFAGGTLLFGALYTAAVADYLLARIEQNSDIHSADRDCSAHGP